MPSLSICSPDVYYDLKMQSFIKKKRQDNDQKWIFQLIDGVACPGTEQVYITTDEWLLCEDIHIGTDQRFIGVQGQVAAKHPRFARQAHSNAGKRAENDAGLSTRSLQ